MRPVAPRLSGGATWEKIKGKLTYDKVGMNMCLVIVESSRKQIFLFNWLQG